MRFFFIFSLNPFFCFFFSRKSCGPSSKEMRNRLPEKWDAVTTKAPKLDLPSHSAVDFSYDPRGLMTLCHSTTTPTRGNEGRSIVRPKREQKKKKTNNLPLSRRPHLGGARGAFIKLFRRIFHPSRGGTGASAAARHDVGARGCSPGASGDGFSHRSDGSLWRCGVIGGRRHEQQQQQSHRGGLVGFVARS